MRFIAGLICGMTITTTCFSLAFFFYRRFFFVATAGTVASNLPPAFVRKTIRRTPKSPSEIELWKREQAEPPLDPLGRKADSDLDYN